MSLTLKRRWISVKDRLIDAFNFIFLALIYLTGILTSFTLWKISIKNNKKNSFWLKSETLKDVCHQY